MNEQEDVEAILDRFRRWLETTRHEAISIDPLATDNESETLAGRADFGVIDLVEEFTALRHEVKLQTKTGRGISQQLDSAVGALRQAIEQFRSVKPREEQAVWIAGKAMAEALADLDEALDRGQRETERTRRRFAEDSARALDDALQKLDTRFSWFGRRLLARYQKELRHVIRGADWVPHGIFDSLLEGYGLIQNRLRRAMAGEEIERINCTGTTVDPERMTVIEVVDLPGAPPGTVVKELRRGYTWKGRVIRYAEVQAVRKPPDAFHEPEQSRASNPEHHEIQIGADRAKRAVWLDSD
jgi:molecular chaperone GrpE